MDKQTKLASEASQQMAKLHWEVEELRCNANRMRMEQEKWKQDMASLQQRLDDTQAQLEQYAKIDITPQKVSQSCVKIEQEIRIGAWGTVTQGVHYDQPVAVKLPHQVVLNQHILERETQLMTHVTFSIILQLFLKMNHMPSGLL